MNPQQPYPQPGLDPQAPQVPQQPPVDPSGYPMPRPGYAAADSFGAQQQYSLQQPQQPQQAQQMPQQGYGAPTMQPTAQSGAKPPRPSTVGSSSKAWMIVSFVFIFTTLSLGGLSGWALVNYFDQKDNVDSKVSSAVALAIKDQKTREAAERKEADKEPNRIFATGDDLGQLSFKYPKNWSVYEAASQDSNKYSVLFNPGQISADSRDSRYALRLSVSTQDYDKAIASYEKAVSSGALKATPVKIDDQSATRFDGEISKEVRGSFVLFKLRDKTVIVQTDAETFTKDFDALIKTITFNK